ncbi:MAG: transcription antitermination factor NusB, partial [Planctomycetota bacterium]
RTRARELAMQALYQLDVQGGDILSQLSRFFKENEQDDLVRGQALAWTRGTWENIGQCDEIILACTLQWQLSRLSAVDKSILRLAVYQLKFCDDIPPKVVLNEAIELAKKYSTEQSPGFINGVLDAVLRKIKQEES